jgi:hypothetical protein
MSGFKQPERLLRIKKDLRKNKKNDEEGSSSFSFVGFERAFPWLTPEKNARKRNSAITEGEADSAVIFSTAMLFLPRFFTPACVGFPLAQGDEHGRERHAVALAGAFEPHRQDVTWLQADHDPALVMLKRREAPPAHNSLEVRHTAGR